MRPGASGVVWGVVYLVFVASQFFLLASIIQSGPGADKPELSLSDLAHEVRAGSIASIEIGAGQGIATDEFGDDFTFQFSRTTNPLHELADLGVSPDELARVDVVVHEPPLFSGGSWPGLQNMLLVVLVGSCLFLMARAGGTPNNQQLLSLTRHRATRFVGDPHAVRFGDVAGVDEAKAELREVVEFLTTPEKFASVVARIPRGVLLVGPPGTGKTLLARAVAGEANVPFFSVSGSEFVEIVVGVGASRVRDLFREAERNAPCIVFVDEIDAIGRQRGASFGAASDEREQSLNQILVEMDGFDSRTNVIVLAATNRADVLDPALLRPGRFDRRVLVPSPDLDGRTAILRVHARGKPFAADVDLRMLARVTTGFSGADLANIVNEGAILAVRHRKPSIGMAELEEAIDRVVAAPDSGARVMAESDRTRSAYHQSGHVLTGRYLEHHPGPSRLTLTLHARRGGCTRSGVAEDDAFVTRSGLKARLAEALSGHAAERLVLGDAGSGAEADITRATDISRRMVKRYGMSQRLGPVALGRTRDYAERTREAIDDEIRALLDEGYRRAMAILTEHRPVLDRLATALLQHETLDGDALERAFVESPSMG